MNKSKTLAIALALQLLSLLLLTQEWVGVSMAGENSSVSLGNFDGATTYPIAMPLSLFALSAIVVSAISQRLTRISAISLAAISNASALTIVLSQVAIKSISALDPQLDRLTGIANTHGIKDVTVSIAAAPWLWAATLAIAAIWLLFGLVWQGQWQRQEKTDRYTTGKPSKKKSADISTIEIWDNQRD
jgi:Tryptophan-associated transmembrane protein (Trp_oprn_chp)